jgi:hypothetical protein
MPRSWRIQPGCRETLNSISPWTGYSCSNAESVKEVQIPGSRLVVDGVVYGLVNVRTNGKEIVCAVLNEKKSKWGIGIFESRF